MPLRLRHAAPASILALTALLFLACDRPSASAGARSTALPPDSSSTRLVILGTGTPNADPDRSGPALAIVAGGHAYLVDAGPGIVRRATAAARADSVPALLPPGLDILFLTHLHSDHTAGLPDLMLSPWVLDRTAPLRVFGPAGTSRMVRLLQEAYSEDIQLRLTGGEPSNKTGWRAEAHDATPGVVYRDSNVTVTAFSVPHGSWPQAFGYKFETKDRTIVISGDTGPSDAIAEQCRQCDILVHEAYSAPRFRDRSGPWQAYHSRYHTSTAELARIAAQAQPRLLVLYHQLYWGDDDEALVRQVRAGWRGPVRSARDLDIF